MLYLTYTIISSVDLAHYGVSRAKRVSVDCGTSYKRVVSSPKEPKYLDSSYKTDLGFGEFFG